MSLLMEALKKAEREKKEAAKRLKEAQEKSGEHFKLEEETQLTNETEATPADGTEIVESNENVDLSATQDARIIDELEEEQLPAALPESSETYETNIDTPIEYDAGSVAESEQDDEGTVEYDTSALSLQDIKSDTLDHPVVEDEDEAKFDDELRSETEEISQVSQLESLSLEDDSSSSFESTNVDQEKKDTTHTLSGSSTSRSIVSAAQLVKDMGIGREVPTPVAAQTVFSAVSRNSERRLFMEWVVFLGLVTVIIIAAGMFYYLKVTPLAPNISSPTVAKGIESETTPRINVEVPENITKPDLSGKIITMDNPGPDTSVNDSEQVVATVETDTTPSTQAGDVTGENRASEQIASDKEAEPETTNTEKEKITDTNKVVARANSTPDNTAVQGHQALPEEITIKPGDIAITRSKSTPQVDRQIADAYAAYQSGNFTVADNLYQKALDRNPESRDALLGKGAVAYQMKNMPVAFENYLKVLKLFPQDVIARSALINMQGKNVPDESESLLKEMIAKDTSEPQLYFLLGNLYARQSRWADAQQAFFDAYRLKNDNADYAYNLAVSLDHLDQQKAALDYYKIALDQADKSRVTFNTSSVINRISSLSTIINQTR